jgi:hypothetical protein
MSYGFFEAPGKTQDPPLHELNPQGWGTLYDVVGSVKRHEELASCGARFSLHLKESFLFPSLRPRLAA